MVKSEIYLVVVACFGCMQLGCASSRSTLPAVVARKPAIASTAETAERPPVVEDPSERAAGHSRILLVSGDDEINVPLPAPIAGTDPRGEADWPTVETRSASEALTLADLQAIAMRNNPTLSQAAAAVDQERGIYRQSGLYPNPQVGYLNSTANQSSPKQSNGVFVSQEIVTSKKLSLAQQSVSQEIKRLQWDQRAQELRVLNDLKIRYYEVLGAQQAVVTAEKLEQLAAESLANVEALFNAKTVSRSDVIQAKVLLETSRIGLADATHRYEAAWQQLATMLGTPALTTTALTGELEGDIPQLDQESCWQKLLAESPQLRASEAELDRGYAELRSARAQAIPNVTLQNVTDYDRISNSTTVSTLVALPIPFYNRNQGNIEKSIADVHVNQTEIHRVQLVLRDQLADAFRRYKTQYVQVHRLKQSIMPNAEENLKLTQQSFRGGEVPFREVVVAQQAYAESRVAYIEALTELRKVIVEIDGLQLTGGLNPAAIGSAIQSQPGGSGQRQRALLNEVRDRASKQLLPAAQIGQ